jgi:hypothetical protein
MSVDVRKLLLSSLVVVSTVLAGGLLASSPAEARTRYGCEWPRVCFYLTAADWNARQPTAAYQDITSGYQTLGSRSRGSYAVFNSRNDDALTYVFSNGGGGCLAPDSLSIFTSVTIAKIKILSSPDC